MELDNPAVVLPSGKMSRQLVRNKRLPRTGRPLEDDLLLVLEQCLDVSKEIDRQVEFPGQLLQRAGKAKRRRILLIVFRWISATRITQRPPYDGLRFQPVAHREIARLRLLDEPVQEAERVPVQFRLVRGFPRRLVARLRACPLDEPDAVGRVTFDVLSHEQD